MEEPAAQFPPNHLLAPSLSFPFIIESNSQPREWAKTFPLFGHLVYTLRFPKTSRSH
ncbi:MAG: hypothetical protein HYW48_02815 [Deltaproteobacteria bacterium]|nr:hypothetical protein [Deltaproteobacteria bacterium]